GGLARGLVVGAQKIRQGDATRLQEGAGGRSTSSRGRSTPGDDGDARGGGAEDQKVEARGISKGAAADPWGNQRGSSKSSGRNIQPGRWRSASTTGAKCICHRRRPT